MSDSTILSSALRRHSRSGPGGLGLALALIALLAVVSPAPTAAWSPGTFSSSSESLLVQLHNQARANAGLKALTVNSTLRNVARARSKDMIERNYFSHSIPPDGHKVFEDIRAAGYCFVSAGENIGWNTHPDDTATQAIHNMFMNSSGHRNNIMGSTWRVIGVGAYEGSTGKKMWTVLFAQPCSSSAPAPKATPKATPKPKPKATPKPATPRPVAQPTPAPTPVPTPVPTAAPTIALPDLEADAETFVPAWLWESSGKASPPPGARPAATSGPRKSPPDQGLRIVDPPISQGLFETIVGDVASTFFGS